MRYLLYKAFTLSLSLFLVNISSAQTIKPFKSGDRIMFVGNSITEAGFYHSYIWLYYMTRFPNTRIDIYNRGIGGDDIGMINDRLDVEVFPEKPTVIVLTFGMNDSGYFEYLRGNADSVMKAKVQKAHNIYLKAEEKLVKHQDIRKIIISSAPYDVTTTATKNNHFPGKEKAIANITDFQQASAKQNTWEFVDLNTEMTAVNLEQQQSNPAYSLSSGDRIHPGNGGHLVMAYFILKAQGLANKEVTLINIDASTNKLVRSSNAKISNLSLKANSINFDYLANALPFPIDTLPKMWNSKSTQAEALDVIPFIKEFNQELIIVQHLENGLYSLKIDGQQIGTWTAEAFSAGINLATQMNTPQYQQAIMIRDMNQERMEIEKRFRQYNWIEFDVLKQRGLLRKHNQAALDTVRSLLNDGFIRGNYENWTKARHAEVREVWNEQMKMLVDKIYKVNKPVVRHIVIEKVK